MNPGLSASMLSVAVANAAEMVFRFSEQEVHPLLVERCYSCHSVAEKTRAVITMRVINGVANRRTPSTDA